MSLTDFRLPSLKDKYLLNEELEREAQKLDQEAEEAKKKNRVESKKKKKK